MLTHHRIPVCLSMVSTDLPIWSTVETAATLYQKERDRFHLLLTEPTIRDREPDREAAALPHLAASTTNRLLWLEISPYRVIMTMQGNGKLSYRHLWEKGVYGTSRYWLNDGESNSNNSLLRMRNFTKALSLQGNPLPVSLQLEYELWADKIQMGCYVLRLQIHH